MFDPVPLNFAPPGCFDWTRRPDAKENGRQWGTFPAQSTSPDPCGCLARRCSRWRLEFGFFGDGGGAMAPLRIAADAGTT